MIIKKFVAGVMLAVGFATLALAQTLQLNTFNVEGLVTGHRSIGCIRDI